MLFTGKVDGVPADLFHDGRTVFAQSRKLALGDLGDAGVVAGPAAHRVGEPSSWSRQFASSGSRSAGRPMRRSMSLLVSPSPRAALPKREA